MEKTQSSGTTFKAKEEIETVPLFCVPYRSTQTEQNTTAPKTICQNHYLVFDSIICKPPFKGGTGSRISISINFLIFIFQNWQLIPESSQLPKSAEKSLSSPYTHSQISSDKNITSRERLHTFALVMNIFSS